MLGSTPVISVTQPVGEAFKIYDTDESHLLTLDWNENDSANRTLNFLVNSGNRSINLSGNLTLANNLITSGNYSLTLTTTAATNVTLPTTGTLATTSNKLSDFAATTSAELLGVISDETGSGALVFANSPALVTPTGIVKGDVGLGNVDNTSDATKDSATATLTNKTLTSPVLQGTVDGWISANESWTYASASTITVPSGAASKYHKGDKIKWTQTTVKYGVIVAVADTVLTIAVNADYVVTDAAITLNYYSHAANPLDYPGWFNFVTTFTGFSADPSGYTYRYNIQGRTVTIEYGSSSAGTSNATSFNMTLPVAANTATYRNIAMVRDNGSLAGGGIQTAAASTTLYISKNEDASGFTASGNKDAWFTLVYEMD